MEKVSTEIQIRLNDVDFNFHVNTVKYVEYILHARYEQLKNYYNYSVEKAFQDGYSWFIKNVNLNYLSPLKLSSKAIVTTWINSMEGRELNLGVEITGDGKPALNGHIILALIDVKTGKSIEIPKKIYDVFSMEMK